MFSCFKQENKEFFVLKKYFLGFIRLQFFGLTDFVFRVCRYVFYIANCFKNIFFLQQILNFSDNPL